MGPSDDREPDLNRILQLNAGGQKWVVARGEYNGSPLFARINTSVRPWAGHSALPIKLGFAVGLNRPDESGLPESDENDQLHAAEDVIRETVEGGATGLHVLVLTTGKMREFVFYIAPGADIGAIHRAVRSAVSTHQVQCMAVQDPEWDAFRRFATG